MDKSLRRSSVLIAVALLALAGSGCTAKMKGSYYQHRAEKCFAAGDYSSAEIEYKHVLRSEPQNGEAWSRLGVIYFYEGRLPEAAAILIKAEQLSTNDLDVRLKLATVYQGMGRLKEAQDEADYVLDRRPQDDEAPLLLARNVIGTNDFTRVRQHLQALRQRADGTSLEVAWGTLAQRQQDFKTAEVSYKRALELDPKSYATYTALAALYLEQMDTIRADAAFQKAAELAPPWSGNGVRYAQFKFLTGDALASEQLLQGITTKAPYYLPAWMALAQLAASKNDFTNALDLLGNVLSRDPLNFEGLTFQGRLELSEGKTGQAISGFERMTAMFPHAPSALYQLAQAYLVNHQTNEASSSLIRALNLDPKYTDASLLLAQIQLAGGDTSPVIVSMRNLVQEQPQVVSAWLLLADAYREQGMVDAAVQIYHELEKEYPKRPQVPVLLGTVFLHEQKNTEARREFEKALLLEPAYLPAVQHLVNMDLEEKRYSEALQRVQQLAVNDPKQASLQMLLGQTLAAQGENSQAESAFSKAISLQPDSQAAYLMLAKLHSLNGQPDQGLAVLDKALAMDPNDVAALTLKAFIYETRKDYQKAGDVYEQILAIAPDNEVALNNLACIYADHLGQPEKAYPLAVHGRNVAPADPAIGDTLGWILYLRGDYAEALGYLRESAGKSKEVAEIQFHLGMADYMSGLETDAKQAFQSALKLPSTFPEKAECQQRVAILNINPARSGDDTFTWLKNWTGSHPDDTVALSRLATIFQSKGMTDQAIASNEAILKANPQNVAATVELARLYAPTDLPKADGLAKAAYRLTPSDPEITHILGRLSFQTGDYQWALSLLQITAQAQPDNPEVQYDLSEALYSFGRVSEARSAMQNALQIGGAFKRSEDARRFLAMTDVSSPPTSAQVSDILKAAPNYVPALMASAALSQQHADAATAEQNYEQVLKNYPVFTPAEKRLAMLYASDPDKAARASSLAFRVHAALPGDLENARLLGVLDYRAGDYLHAADLFEQCERQNPQDPELLYYLGITQYGLKRGTESKSDLQQALALNLSGTQATEAKRILAELK